MATFLDTTLVGQTSVVFSWVFIFVVTFAVAEKYKLLPDTKLNALLAVALAIVAGTSQTLLRVIETLAPGFAIIAIFVLFFILLTNFLGLDTTQVLGALGGRNATWYILIPLILIVVFAISTAVGQDLLDEQVGGNTDDDSAVERTHREEVLNTLTDPKVLGLVLILMIAVLTVALMASAPPS